MQLPNSALNMMSAATSVIGSAILMAVAGPYVSDWCASKAYISDDRCASGYRGHPCLDPAFLRPCSSGNAKAAVGHSISVSPTHIRDAGGQTC